MAAAVTAHYDLRLEAEETLALSQDLVPGETEFTHDTTETTRGTLNATSTPAVTKVWSDSVTLVAGAATLDLTSLTGPAGASVDFTGLKVHLVKLACPSSNTAGITVDRGASNAYNLFGEDNSSAEQVEVMPGASILVYHGNDKTEDVDATHSDVQLAGTGTEAIEVILVAG